MTAPVRIGTRGSTLALAQARAVAEALAAAGLQTEVVVIETEGDRRRPDTTWGEGAFVTAIEAALRAGRVDVAVHSAKDLPVRGEAGLAVAAYLRREDPADALVLPAGTSAGDLAGLPDGSRVGTDSPRRTGFLRAARPGLRLHPLHGNVDTRLRRLDAGETDALVLAVAGLARLGRLDRVAERLDPATVPPAPGQGAVALQVRADDGPLRRRLADVDHGPTRLAVETERAVLAAAGGGCRAPIGALATVDGDRLEIVAGFARPDGSGAAVERRSVAAGAGPAEREAVVRELVRALDRRLPGVRAIARDDEGSDAVVLVLREAARSADLLDALAARGLVGVSVPAIETGPAPDPGALARAIGALGPGAWVAVTSVNGAEAALAAARAAGRGATGLRWAAIGSATGSRLADAGIRAWRPSDASSAAIARELPVGPGDEVLLARGDLADGALPAALGARGATVRDVTAYVTREAPGASVPALRAALDRRRPFAAVALSGSEVRGLLALAERLGPAAAAAVRALPIVCAGPATASVAEGAGLHVAAVAGSPEPAELARLTAGLLPATPTLQPEPA